MAFDRFVLFDVFRYPVYLDGVSYRQYETWCEFVLSPVLQNDISGSLTATTVIRVPYSPILTEAFATRDNDGINLVNVSWKRFNVDGWRYVIDGMQITGGNRHIEITGIDGINLKAPA